MSKRLTKKTMSLFESIKHIDENGTEYWTSRSLWKILEYNEYRNFLPVIEKAKIGIFIIFAKLFFKEYGGGRKFHHIGF